MTEDTPTGEGLSAVRILEIANHHFDQALDRLEKNLKKMESAEEAGAPGLAKAIQDTRKATQILFEERVKVEQFRKKETGVANNCAIDLGAARDEIKRRLALLHAAKDAGPISE